MAVREDLKEARKEYDKTEDDLKSLQSVGQIIGEVLRQLDEERSEWIPCVPFDHWHQEEQTHPGGSGIVEEKGWKVERVPDSPGLVAYHCCLQ